MIYRVHLYDDSDGSTGFAFFASSRGAERRLAEWRKESPETRQAADIDKLPTPRTKAAVIAMLGRWAGEPQNG